MQYAKPLPPGRAPGWARRFFFLLTAHCPTYTGGHPLEFGPDTPFIATFRALDAASRRQRWIRKSRHAKQIGPDTRFPSGQYS